MPFRPPRPKKRNIEQTGIVPPSLPTLLTSSHVEDGFVPQSLQPPSAVAPTESAQHSRTASSTVTMLKTPMASSTSLSYGHGQQNYFRSRRIKKDELERPWLNQKDAREKWVTIIPIVGLVCGLAVAGLLVWMGLRSAVDHNYCPVLDEDFSSWNDAVWTKEVEVGGYG